MDSGCLICLVVPCWRLLALIGLYAELMKRSSSAGRRQATFGLPVSAGQLSEQSETTTRSHQPKSNHHVTVLHDQRPIDRKAILICLLPSGFEQGELIGGYPFWSGKVKVTAYEISIIVVDQEASNQELEPKSANSTGHSCKSLTIG
jgi:hypothetical protein